MRPEFLSVKLLECFLCSINEHLIDEHHRFTGQQSTKTIIKILEKCQIDVLSFSKNGCVSQSFSHLTSNTNKISG